MLQLCIYRDDRIQDWVLLVRSETGRLGQGKESDGNQNLVTRLTLRSPEVNHHNYDLLILNKGAKTIQGLP